MAIAANKPAMATVTTMMINLQILESLASIGITMSISYYNWLYKLNYSCSYILIRGGSLRSNSPFAVEYSADEDRSAAEIRWCYTEHPLQIVKLI